MFRTLITLVIVWFLLAFNWDYVVTNVNKYQLVDKTKKIVYNIKRSVTNE